MIILSAVLGLSLAGFGGFLAGKRFASEKAETPSSLEIAPVSAEALASIDASLALLGEGNPRRALLELQKLQQGLTHVYGIDFLLGRLALAAGETSLAKDSFQRSLSKKELEDEAALMIALIDAGPQSKIQGTSTMADPAVSAEAAVDHYVTLHPEDPLVHALYAELLRHQGSYRSAAEALHRAILRCHPSVDPQILAARAVLVAQQNAPSKDVPSMSGVAGMDGLSALAAGYAAFGNHRSEEGVLFLERASEFYPKSVFRQILADTAFDEFRSDSKFKDFSSKFENPEH